MGGEVGVTANQPQHGGEVDNGAAARLEHVRDGKLAHEKDAFQVHRQHALPTLFGDFGHRAIAPGSPAGPRAPLPQLGSANEVMIAPIRMRG